MSTGGELRQRNREGELPGTQPGTSPADAAQDVPAGAGPRPLQIVRVEEHSFDLDLEALKTVLLSEEVANRKVVVVSVAGAFRKGKSFLLDYLLRFLNNKGLEGSEEWLGEEEEPLVGFSWRGGFERDTTGILIWSKPFITTLPSGDEVAILLLDTQGAFDRLSTVQDNATIFALSTMISSIQVYNLILQLQEDDLQHLHLFTEYGKMAMKDTSSVSSPFQSLVFLIRDWYHHREHPHGLDGGMGYLNTMLQITSNQHEDLKMVREHIRECFDSVSCYLMPSPGSKVQSGDTDGKLSEMDSSFREHLKSFAPFLLSPEKLVVKTINGAPLTGKTLLDIFGIYMTIFQSSDLPAPKSMLLATAEANNISALVTAFDKYTKEMEMVSGADTPYLSPERLKETHTTHKKASLELFTATPKMGGKEISDKYLAELEKKIDDSYESFVKRNESKHILNAYRTPAVLGVVMILSYLVSTILDTLGVESLSQTAIFGLYVPILMLLLWAYIRYSGEWQEVGRMIDNITTTVWEQTLQPLYAAMVRRALNQAVNLSNRQDEKNKKNV